MMVFFQNFDIFLSSKDTVVISFKPEITENDMNSSCHLPEHLQQGDDGQWEIFNGLCRKVCIPPWDGHNGDFPSLSDFYRRL